MSGHIWLIAAYASLVLFFAGLARVIIGIARQPMHLRWELAPLPGEGSKSSYGGSSFEEPDSWSRPHARSIAGEAAYMMKEVLLLHTIWKRHRSIWPFSFAMHTGIYLLFFTMMFLFLSVVLDMLSLTSASSLLESASYFTAAPAYALGASGAAGMLLLRIARRDLRAYSGLQAYFNLALLAALFLTGCIGMLSDGYFMYCIKTFIDAVLHADPDTALTAAGAAHISIALIFLAMLSYTSMSHFAAKFFTFHRVLWDDRPQNGDTEREALDLLRQPVGWSAGHIKSDGLKNWIDAAKGE